MLVKKIIPVLLFAMSFISLYAQQADMSRPWKNKKCAVSLTYDDGLNVHLDKVIPVLDSAKLKGTFYVPGNAPCVSKRINEWRSAAKSGHELGNHTLFHACVGGIKGREWVNPNYDLSKYTAQRMIDEVLMANTFLSAIDGKTKRSFAYTCGDMYVDSVYFMDKVKDQFVSARGVTSEMLPISKINIWNIGSYMMMESSADEMINLVKEAMKTNSYLVFLFHGVGGEHNINVSEAEHRKLIQFLKQNEKDIWIAPFIDVSEFIVDYKAHKK
jgi:peptidoglycan-N-acetylglucosamine deacetylase